MILKLQMASPVIPAFVKTVGFAHFRVLDLQLSLYGRYNPILEFLQVDHNFRRKSASDEILHPHFVALKALLLGVESFQQFSIYPISVSKGRIDSVVLFYHANSLHLQSILDCWGASQPCECRSVAQPRLRTHNFRRHPASNEEEIRRKNCIETALCLGLHFRVSFPLLREHAKHATKSW